MSFAEEIRSVAIGEIDDDGFMELILASMDGYCHTYDLPALESTTGCWPMARHDVRRTGTRRAAVRVHRKCICHTARLSWLGEA